MDLAKKANITGRSTMTKGQLITALSTLQNLTSAIVDEAKQAVVENKQLAEKKLESKLAFKEPETRPDFIKTINERLKVLREMVPENRLDFVPSNAKIRSMPKRALENLHIRLGNLEGDVLDEQRDLALALAEQARKDKKKSEVERKLSTTKIKEERKEAPSVVLASEEKQRRAQEQLNRVARIQEMRKEKELKDKADKFRLQQQLKRLKIGLDDAKWREVLRLVSESEMKENEEFSRQFEKATEMFDNEMKTIEAKEKAENKAIRDTKAREITQKANDRLRQRAFDMFKERLEIKRRASEVISSAWARENRRDTLKQALESKVATQDRLRREEIARKEIINKVIPQIVDDYKSAIEQISDINEIKNITKSVNEKITPLLEVLSSDERKQIKDSLNPIVTTRIIKIEEEAKRIADELIAEEEAKKPRTPPKKPKPPKKDSGDLARKIDDLRTELKLPKKESYKQLTTFGIDKLENMIADLEKIKKQREEESARQREEARLYALEEEKDLQDDADSKRRTEMYNILQKSKPQITYKNLLKLKDSKITELSKETDEKWKSLPASQQKRNYVDPSLDLTKKPIRQTAPPVAEPEPPVPPVPPVAPVAIRVPQPPGSASTRAPDYVTAQPNTRNIPRQGDQPIMAEPTVLPSLAPASAMVQPEIEEGNSVEGNSSQEGEGKKSSKEFGIDNHSIDEFLSKYGNEYLGCIAHDEIPSKIYPKIRPRSRGFFVINTDPSWKSGEHWQCVFFDARPNGSGSIEFYDSFADPIDPKMQADLKGVAERLDAKTYLKLKENRVKQQHDDSDNCGYFCMNFITSRMRGKPFTEASGFDESVKGEADIHKFKKMNGFGFLPSFGQIASTIARPFTRAVKSTVERVKNVASDATKFAQNIKERIFFPEKKLPSSIQPTFEKYKNFKILSAQLRREPILAFVDKFINLISFGKFNQAKKDLGYDKMFHLSLILQLENGPKLLVEKNERINMTTSFKDGPQVQYYPAQGVLTIPGNPTLGEFYEKTLQTVGDHQFFTYNAFQQNCQAFIADLLRSNGALTPEAQNFVMQDAQTLIKQLPFYVSKVAQFATDTAGRVRQFFGFGGRSQSKRSAGASKKVTRRKKFQDFMNKIKKSTV